MAAMLIGLRMIKASCVSSAHRHQNGSLTNTTPKQGDSMERHNMCLFSVMQALSHGHFIFHHLLSYERCCGRFVSTQADSTWPEQQINLMHSIPFSPSYWLKEAFCVFWLPEVGSQQSVWIPESFRATITSTENRCTRVLPKPIQKSVPHQTGEASHVALSNSC